MPMNSEQIGERNSSRVLAAPGGHSSMGSLLGGFVDSASQPEPLNSSRRAPVTHAAVAGEAPVAGRRVELRTEHTGITVGNVSSRVLAAPGGQSEMASLISGGYVQNMAPKPLNSSRRGAPFAQAPAAGEPLAAGQRIEVRTEHTGITVGNVSSRVLAAPGGRSEMASLIGGGCDQTTAGDRIAALKARRQAQTLGDATNAVM